MYCCSSRPPPCSISIASAVYIHYRWVTNVYGQRCRAVPGPSTHTHTRPAGVRRCVIYFYRARIPQQPTARDLCLWIPGPRAYPSFSDVSAIVLIFWLFYQISIGAHTVNDLSLTDRLPPTRFPLVRYRRRMVFFTLVHTLCQGRGAQCGNRIPRLCVTRARFVRMHIRITDTHYCPIILYIGLDKTGWNCCDDGEINRCRALLFTEKSARFSRFCRRHHPPPTTRRERLRIYVIGTRYEAVSQKIFSTLWLSTTHCNFLLFHWV